MMNTDRNENRVEMSQFFNETEILDTTLQVQPLNAPGSLRNSADSLHGDLLLQEDFLRMHRRYLMPQITNKKFILLHASLLSRERTIRLSDKLSSERRQALEAEQKIIEKDAYEVTHSKGIFGLSVSKAEEDEQIRDCLPEFEEFSLGEELCFDIDVSKSPLPLEEKTSMLRYAMAQSSKKIMKIKKKRQELLWRLPFGKIPTVSDVQTYEMLSSPTDAIKLKLQQSVAPLERS